MRFATSWVPMAPGAQFVLGGGLGADRCHVRKILFVDDEPQILFAIVLSDMQMPGMNGAAFLARVREIAPDTTRMLLTGHADVNSAIAAVNEGQIFRFLTKPCPLPQIRMAFKAAEEQHRLITAERVLLEQTLHGCIKTLVDVLSLVSPVCFGRAMRIKKHVSELAATLQLAERWQVEVAAMLSQLACVTLPSDTVERLCYGKPLEEGEKESIARLPAITEQLLGNIPRMEVVRGILARCAKPLHVRELPTDDPEKELITRGAHVLRIALDFDALEIQGNTSEHAIDIMRGRSPGYDPATLDAFATLQRVGAQKEEIRELPIVTIREGMVLAEDLKTANGTLLATAGYEITASFVERARHFRPGFVKRSVRVIVRA